MWVYIFLLQQLSEPGFSAEGSSVDFSCRLYPVEYFLKPMFGFSPLGYFRNLAVERWNMLGFLVEDLFPL